MRISIKVHNSAHHHVSHAGGCDESSSQVDEILQTGSVSYRIHGDRLSHHSVRSVTCNWAYQ